MYWARTEITPRQPCKNSTDMDTGGQKKARKTKGDMEENCGERERKRKHLGFRSWNDVAMRAKDNTEWRRLIHDHGPILLTEKSKRAQTPGYTRGGIRCLGRVSNPCQTRHEPYVLMSVIWHTRIVSIVIQFRIELVQLTILTPLQFRHDADAAYAEKFRLFVTKCAIQNSNDKCLK